MSSTQLLQLQTGGVIPDVLSNGTSFSNSLTVVWPSATLDTPGKELGREETQPEPTLYVNPAVILLAVMYSMS